MHLVAAEQFFAREGHLTVPRKHVETIAIGDGQAQRDLPLKLRTWVDNQRRRAATLTPERMEQLSKVGMRWA
ncbi:helicase associated domain-containing protein [Streptomyces sp. NPDC091259]|uniref:helicase associated domain-containing protein n=1 Tax=Streptomyces sp. NPDC091259 TaxID=3365976 RepID=UPI0037FC324B